MEKKTPIELIKEQVTVILHEFIFEPNDAQTRVAMRARVEQCLELYLTLNLIFDYAVVCDETNNTPDDVDAGIAEVLVLVKLYKDVEFIKIPFRLMPCDPDIEATDGV